VFSPQRPLFGKYIATVYDSKKDASIVSSLMLLELKDLIAAINFRGPQREGLCVHTRVGGEGLLLHLVSGY